MKSICFLLIPFSIIAIRGYAQDTFSIVAADSVTREVGSAGASCVDLFFFGISDAGFLGDLIPDTGAINTQASYTPNNQVNARARMRAGDSPAQVISWLNANDAGGDPTVRQYGIAGFTGNDASATGYTGVNCIDYKNHLTGNINGIHYSIQGNILLGQHVLDSMEANFRNTEGNLACRLMAALQGANMVGADTRCSSNGSSSLFAFVKVSRPTDAYGSPFLNLGVRTASGAGIEPVDSLQKLFDMHQGCWPASLDKKSIDKLVKVYPNPTSGKMNIVIEERLNMAPHGYISFYNLSGENIHNSTLTSAHTEIELGELERGIYFYQVKYMNRLLKMGKIVFIY